MIYGRYNELVNGVYFMVYEPTFTSVGGAILYGISPYLEFGRPFQHL